jgi:ABC-type multidrug transport system fused ATPase/permease subunit
MNIPLRQYWGLLVEYLRPYRRRVWLLAVLLLSSIGLQIINPQIMRTFIDATRSGGPAGALTGVAALFLVVALVQQVAAISATYVGEDLGWKATNKLRLDLGRHCLQLDMSFHNARTPGEMIERIDGDVRTLANFFSQLVIQVIGSMLLLTGILVLLFLEDWRVGLTLTIFVLVASVALTRMRNIAVPYWTATRQASAEMYGFLEERLAGTQDIRANGAQAYVMRHFYRLQRAAWRTTIKAGLMATVMTNTTWVLFAIGNAAGLVVGASLYQAGTLTIGGVYLILYYSTLLARPIELITRQMDDLQKAGASIGRVKELTEMRSRLVDGPGIPLPEGPLAVEFDHVSFGYDEEMVLHDLSFCLRPGKVLGLLGRTGSGKTTLTRLLLRLYDPSSGAIRLGGEDGRWDIREARLADLGRRIGTVTQNVQLFDATVRDNLTFFDRRIRDDEILRVIEELGLRPWYQSLAEGLDTRLAGGGAGLSAGEAQLLAFTRIFLKDPSIVILDEASSRLDPATEQLIERAVGRLIRGRTAIIIAHHLGTVERADEIMILEGGRIREHGARAELLRDPQSLFSHLLQTGGVEEVLA